MKVGLVKKALLHERSKAQKAQEKGNQLAKALVKIKARVREVLEKVGL